MKTADARRWAYFIVNKLGLPYSKTEICRFAEMANDSDIWDRYIASNDIFLAAAKANHIEGPEDVYRFFSDADYSSMRSTFPSKANGRRIIGPRIIPIQKLWKKEPKRRKTEERLGLAELIELSNSIGKYIFHAADSGLVYGKGVITGVNTEKGTIIVKFESGDTKVLGFKYCLDRSIIQLLN